MATCRKCGKPRLRKLNSLGVYSCPHCGPQPVPVALDPHRASRPVPPFTLNSKETNHEQPQQ